MKDRERFLNTLNFKPVDRLPMIEWAGWWDKTIDRWKKEGLPNDLEDAAEIREYFGLDRVRQYWLPTRKSTFPKAERRKGVVSDMESYIQIKEHLYPEEVFDRETVAKWAVEQKRGDMVVWITLDGFFWFPRELFGVERHLYAFYDRPKVMRAMNQDLLQYNLRALDQFCQVCRPDFMTFAEDMSYNHGPMISKSLFDEFMAPYYKQIVPRLKEYGIIPLVDSDGNIESMVSWFTDVGIEGFLPLERQSGVDILRLRRENSRLKMIGGYDKMVMSKGEEEMRAEFERILPMMRQGGYIPSVDHQTPPEVSLENYRIYLKLLNEYCRKATQ
mgnify:CR=1 FL=1